MTMTTTAAAAAQKLILILKQRRIVCLHMYVCVSVRDGNRRLTWRNFFEAY